MKICGACEKELHRDSFSGKQWKLRRSIRRCKGCIAAGNELALFTKGRERSADDECPICSRPFPRRNIETTLYRCCMKSVCNGCTLEIYKRGKGDACPFCRTKAPARGDEQAQLDRLQDRVLANDPMAIHALGLDYRDGDKLLAKDSSKAVELFERAAKLGLKEAHFDLACQFIEHTDDESTGKDISRALEHYEIAAKQGHVGARHSLGVYELESGNYGLALKHWMISAKLGDEGSLFNIRTMYTGGLALKADYAEAMRGYHDAMIEMSSPERDEAKQRMEYLDSLGLWS